MNILGRQVVLALIVVVMAASDAWAQRWKPPAKPPQIGYVFPAGGRQGTQFEVVVGGQFLEDVKKTILSGQGVEATLVKYERPLTQREINQLREKFDEARKRLQEMQKEDDKDKKKKGNENQGKKGAKKGGGGQLKDLARIALIAQEMGVTAEEIRAFREFFQRRNDPKRQLNPQIAETVTLRVTIAADASLGRRELRLLTPGGVSNPLVFQVGRYPEKVEEEPNDRALDTAVDDKLPVVLNGQIMPGDVDRFSFDARKGQKLVVAVRARDLIPYLADAVPGWFQATVALYDAKGTEVAYDDDYRFQPDPVLCYEIAQDGRYTLEIKDSIYRGREDFVYRITLGEVPFVTSVFPLGVRRGGTADVRLEGWNLPIRQTTVSGKAQPPGIGTLPLDLDPPPVNEAPFAFDRLSSRPEKEPNNRAKSAQLVLPPKIIDGRIDRPGDRDVFRFHGGRGDWIVVEVLARRLGSPLDSVLKLTGPDGRVLAASDDEDDKASGLLTHHADSRLSVELPEEGDYLVHLSDAQNHGGPEYAYRLRISPPRLDFALRVVPSTINARPGTNVLLTIHALRHDGFADPIDLKLIDPPEGFLIDGGRIPAGQDVLRLTLSVPIEPSEEPFMLRMEGRAKLDGKTVRREAVPAEDRMQAFLYRHLVPSDAWLATVTGRNWRINWPRPLDPGPVRLVPGETTRLRLKMPRGRVANEVRLVLDDPPEGVTIQELIHAPGELTVVFTTDAKKAAPGVAGNLIFNAFLERTVKDKNKRETKRRVPLGPLPAVPFEIADK
ncbi:MAG: PPC domain-containing protein [Pirellulales bacterium]|nr:PPC domain-containing protein [Pirellulales bacterium]